MEANQSDVLNHTLDWIRMQNKAREKKLDLALDGPGSLFIVAVDKDNWGSSLDFW